MEIVDQRTDLLAKYPILKPMLKSRAFQPVLQWITLAGFVLAILTGWIGTPAGNRNFGIVFVWIVWWAALMLVLVPLFGRAWCAACPIPAPGEWLQRRGIISRIPERLRTLRYRWPRWLKNIWLQNAGFVLMALFSAIILTRPNVTAWVLLGLTGVGMALSLLFDNRVFCRYVCPVGGFIGLYATTAPLALRVKDSEICLSHTPKDCITGNINGYGCPWLTYPGSLTRNVDCGLCTECLKTCPKDNITLYWRASGDDLTSGQEPRLDEAYKALILLGSALVYPAVFLGPWGWLKNWASMGSLSGWALYAVGFLAITLGILPGLFWLTSFLSKALSKADLSATRLFTHYAYAVIPLGLAAWVAFSFGFVLVNGSYAISTLSDPFGWGWNLLGTASFPWSPFDPMVIAVLQVGALIGGLAIALKTIYQTTKSHSNNASVIVRAVLPVGAFMLAFVLASLWFYLG
jgi:4Fe-4S binding protein